MESILVVDDEQSIRDLIVRALDGRPVVVAASGAEGRAAVAAAGVVLLDVMLGDENGLELLSEFLAEDPTLSVIVMTAHGSVESAVEAMKRGAFHYITKPFSSLDELRLIVDRAARERDLRREHDRLSELLIEQDRFEGMVGSSEPMVKVYDLIRRVAKTDATILITGESGTGKELVARALYNRSERSKRPFVDINCAAIPATLLEAELFGHEKGAFTGAHRSRKGLFESANGGTIFLDEIGDIPIELQAKLLRVIDDKSFMRLGSSSVKRVDVRLIAATNRNLREEVTKGRFREDLYFRLAVINIEVPPLRSRRDDLIKLISHLLPNVPISPEALRLLSNYAWPGNIRELKNLAERFKGFGFTSITVDNLPEAVRDRFLYSSSDSRGLTERVEEYEKEIILAALRDAGGSRSQASRCLGVSRQALQYKLEKYGISPEG